MKDNVLVFYMLASNRGEKVCAPFTFLHVLVSHIFEYFLRVILIINNLFKKPSQTFICIHFNTNTPFPPSHIVSPPCHNLSAPSHNVLPPRHNLSAPSQNVLWPVHNLSPHSHNVLPSYHNLSPPPHNVLPPIHNLSPPAHIINSPSHISYSPESPYPKAVG